MAKDTNSITAIVSRDNALEWTTARIKKKGGLEVTGHESFTLPTADESENVAEETATRLKKTVFGKSKGRIVLAVDSNKTLMRITDLPSTDPDELEGMVELQVDKFSPFPIEHLVISHEILSTQEESSRVLVAAVQRPIIESLSASFAAAKIVPNTIDIHILGWWQLLKEENHIPGEGTQFLILVDPTGTELIVTQNGVPLIVRALGGHEHVSPEEFVSEIAEETNYTLTTLESEWGLLHTPEMIMWHRHEAPDTLAEKLSAECYLKVTCHSLDNLAPLSEGIARHAAQSMERATINLALREWPEQEKRRVTRKRLITATASLLTLWAVIMGALFGGSQWAQAELKRLEEKANELAGPAAAIKEMGAKIKELEQYAERTHSGLECVRETVVLLPQDIDLTLFSYYKANDVKMKGQAKAAHTIYDYVEALEQSSLFTTVKPGPIRRKTVRGGTVSEFSLTADLPGEDEDE